MGLVAEIDAGGGCWSAGSHVHPERQVVDRVREQGVRSLRLGFSDVRFLQEVPDPARPPSSAPP